jgi:hypothetical protein
MSMRSIAPVLTAALMVLMSLNGLMDFSEAPTENENKELLEVVDASYATDPGHMVFAQYITSDNCGYCMSYGSPAHKKLKTDWADTYTYVSLHSASYGNTADAESGNVNPILAVSHLGESGGAPKTSFGDAQDPDSHFMTGCGGNTCWDSGFSNGGRVHSTVGNYALDVVQSDNGDGTSDITITASYVGAGSAPLSSYTLYAAVTEEVCNSHAYTDGTKGGHCWEAWLLNGGAYVSNSGNVGGGTGFETVSLASGSGSASWTVPNSLVAGGSSNMLTVGALYSGWSTSSAMLDVFTASDSSMVPLIDVGIESLTSDNQDGAPGFVPGDTLDIEVIVRNRGVDTYSDGGTLSVYLTQGGQDTLIDSTSLNTLTSGGASDMQSFTTTFDTSSIQTSANGHSVLKAVLSGLTDDGNGANNVGISYVAHDFSPSTDAPMAAGQTTIPRGGSLDFDVSGNSRDSVDTLVTMTAEFEVTPAGSDQWASDWVTAPNSVTAAGTQYERYVFTVNPIPSAGSGDYDVRARLTDARGQSSDWRSSSSAFTLMNGLPVVVDPHASGGSGACPEWPGMPSVKVETSERISLSGLVCDAETPLTQLSITSNDPAFMAWHPATGEIEVEFTTMQYDAFGNSLPQGIGLSIDDGEDVNTGTLQFNVIENGQPRWSSVGAQSFDEGGSASVNLAQFLSDTDDDGNPASVMNLSLSVISIEPAGIVSANIYGYSLTLEAMDEDAFGSVIVTVRATDLDGQTGETVVHVHVQNVNDAPRFDMVGLEGLMIQSGQTLEIDLGARLTDVDDEDLEIWTSIAANPPGAAQFNAITGLLTASYQGAGDQTITITATDSHGATGTWQLVIEVVDTLPLAWSTDGVNGDLDITVVNMTFGNDPMVFVVQITDTDLSEILISWSICNTQTGVCSDFGEEEPTIAQLRAGYSFGTPPASGMGVANFDQLKVDVKAVDSNGFNRESSGVPFDASEADSGDDVTPPVDTTTSKDENGGNDESGVAGSGLSGTMLGIIVGLTILIVIAGVLAAMLLRGGREEEPGFDWGTEATFAVPGAEAAPVMAVAAAAPATDVVVDYTHLPVGGQYISGHAGETVYLAPNGTAWTMQADNSFVRTA